jgi:hypothetical protein
MFVVGSRGGGGEGHDPLNPRLIHIQHQSHIHVDNVVIDACEIFQFLLFGVSGCVKNLLHLVHSLAPGILRARTCLSQAS